MTGPTLRADAARNADQIRVAALAAFHGRGLDTPLADIAAAAGVSKATIYNRFGGRSGLVDAVIEQLVATELRAVMEAVRAVEDAWQRLAGWVRARRDLQYREPAFTDIMIGSHAQSRVVAALAADAARVTSDAIRAARDAGELRRDLTSSDVHWADVANGLALRQLSRPRRRDYDRRTEQFIDGLRSR